MLKIIVDAMGGDNAPQEIVKGALDALADPGISLILTGDGAAVERELSKYGAFDSKRVEVMPCTEIITNDDMPTQAVRAKRDSSLVVGLRRLKEDPEAGGFVSAGSTGAVLTGGFMHIGRIKGVMRPALCPAIPNVRGTFTLLCDCGANVECKAPQLAQFAVMATAYARAAYGIRNPKVGLLSNGTEEHKGDPLHQEAHALLKEMKNIDFCGNVEGRDIMYGDVDVVVSDGFSGNIALKSIEGCGKTVGDLLKREFTSSFGAKLGYLVTKKHILGLKNMLDYSRLGGSVFLGLRQVVVKSHGSSKAASVKASVLQAAEASRGGLIGSISDLLEKEGFGGGGDA